MDATRDSATPARSALDRLLFPDRWIYDSRHPRFWAGLCFAAGAWNLLLGICGTVMLRHRRWLALLALAAGTLQVLGGFRMYRLRLSARQPPRG